jgi:Cu2+-exporting ATPase
MKKVNDSDMKNHQEHERHEKMKHEGHHDHHAMMEEDFKRRFSISAIVTIPVLILSPTIQNWFNFTVPRFTGYNIVLFLLAS